MASTGEVWKLGHRPALDGVRGIAILLVLVSHLHLPGVGESAAVGVAAFFTLSGFLITALQLERADTLRVFWTRRAARLLPAMLVCLLLYVALQVLLGGDFHDRRMILGSLLYVENWVQATGDYDPNSGVGHLWSLAVEEQFYLLWPLALLWLRRVPRRWVLVLLACGILASVALRVHWYWTSGYWRAYYGFDSRVDELLVGCAVAFVFHGSRAPRRAWPAGVVWVGVAGVVALSWIGDDALATTVMPTGVALLTGVVLTAASTGTCPRWLTSQWLQWVGRRSYAIYLYHFPLRWAVEQYGMPWWVNALLVLSVTLLLAEVSWRHLERPAVRAVRQPRKSTVYGWAA